MTRPSILYGAILVAVSITPLVALAAPSDFKGLANLIVSIIRGLTGAAIAIGVVYFLWGMVSAMTEAGSAKGWERFRGQILWGVITLFVMFAIWAILRLLGNTLFGTNNFQSL